MKHSDSIPRFYGKIYRPNASPLQIASFLIIFNVVSIPNRDFSVFQQLMPETLTVFSFQGSFATTSRIISFQPSDLSRGREFKSLKPITSKLFRLCDNLKQTKMAANPCRIRNTAINFEPSEKTPTGCRNLLLKTVSLHSPLGQLYHLPKPPKSIALLHHPV